MCTYLDQVGPTYYFRRSVPQELQAVILTVTGKPRTEFKISLRTKDRETAKRLLPDYVKQTDREFDAARAKLAAIPLAAAPARSPAPFDPFAGWTQEQFEHWEAHQAGEAAIMAAEDENRENAEAWLRDLPTDHPAAILVKEAREEAGNYRERYRRRKRRDKAAGESQGGEIPLPSAYLPEMKNTPPRTPQRISQAVTVTGLFKAYAATGNLSPAIVREWMTKIDKFVAFIGHDDARRVTTENVRAWRNHVRDEILPGNKRRSPQTVNSGHLSPIRSAFKYGVSEGLIPHDPAKEVTRVSPVKVAKIREKDFTKAEQRIILSAASAVDTSGSLARQSLVRRWVPWICAYTGARVNEITQLRAEDVQQIDGHWVIKITPEAGRVKTNDFRYVPVHEHLIEQGFIAVAKAQKQGPIFYDPHKANPDSERGQYKKAGERLALWVRGLGITDPSIKPNHAWRHTFKTIALEVGMHERAADYMQGHVSKGVGRSYGHATIKALAEQMALVPRFETG